VPNKATTVTGTATGGWAVSTVPSDGAVPMNAVSAQVTLSVDQIPTTTTITAPVPTSMSLPSSGSSGSITFGFTVTPGTVTAGTVTAWYRKGTSGTWLGPQASADGDDGQVALTFPAGTAVGSYQVQLRYSSGAGGVWADSTSATKTFTVNQDVDATITYNAGTGNVKASIAPTAAAGHGSLTIEVSATGNGGWTTLSGCTPTSSAATLTCSVTQGTSAQHVRASWDGDANYEDDTSTSVTVPAAPSGGGGGGGNGTPSG